MTVPAKYGTAYALHPFDCIDRYVLTEGFYESEVLEAVRPFLQSGAVLWVVGANFGLHAITAKALHAGAQVIAFEPSPATVSRLIANCGLNRVLIDVPAYAHFDRSTQLPFFVNVSGNPGMSTLFPIPGFQYDHKLVVATRTTAEVIEEKSAPSPTALILDAERAEAAVLWGFGRRLKDSNLHLVIFEAPNDFLATGQPTGLHELLHGAEFHLQILQRRESTAHTLSDFAASR